MDRFKKYPDIFDIFSYLFVIPDPIGNPPMKSIINRLKEMDPRFRGDDNTR
jgi:hypothetical protein